MRNLFYGMLSLVLLIGTSAFTERNNVTVNLEKSSVTWLGKKVTGKHAGTIGLKSAALEMDGDALTGGSFVIDMTSIKCTDDMGNMTAKLEGHLKSDDFFGVEKFPTAKFSITKVASLGTPGDFKITGNLTIKETTKEIKFKANVSDGYAKADITVDRSDFNVKYGSGSFFDNLGDKTIYDDFNLTISLALDK